ncbi:hypothetical protein KOR42_18300 [Thalassoglobus neptunius]|uniref:DUF1598 domain-containing protein n=1 Tax=Thalassoglobus neptunius TaxID=1938619 RepID=A0A5C5X8H7_9PLAN|nr:DUF1598 domain-containing protein [Thalassoglobus neptunius]TWT58455.1 hypothetical protein KOR42_18300 [Thalassoglobus neptunius]
MCDTLKILLCCAILVISLPSNVPAQQAGGGNGNGNGNGNNGNQNVGGILIDADGIVRTSPTRRISRSELKDLQSAFTEQLSDPTLIEQNEARVLSLKQLDQALRSSLAKDPEIPPAIAYLAGLQRIDYVVIDVEQQDIRLVGPAEGFGPGPDGQILGNTTGRPPMKLDDLVVALRSTISGQNEIGVSIDPTNENLSKLQRFVRANSSVTSTSSAQRRIRTMATILGNQQVSIWGVPDDSHFALALVEADLRMKRIALGLDPSRVRGISSHLALLRPQGNSLQRWWFMPLYEPIGTNAEKTVFAIKGQRAQLMAQEEISDATGDRSASAVTRKSTERFAQQFTAHFEELAARHPAFAELQSLYDLALAGALIDQNWDRGNVEDVFPVLMQDARLPKEVYSPPRFVASKSTTKKAGGVLLGLVGGVTIDAGRVARDVRDEGVSALPGTESPAPEGSWWWNPQESR